MSATSITAHASSLKKYYAEIKEDDEIEAEENHGQSPIWTEENVDEHAGFEPTVHIINEISQEGSKDEDGGEEHQGSPKPSPRSDWEKIEVPEDEEDDEKEEQDGEDPLAWKTRGQRTKRTRSEGGTGRSQRTLRKPEVYDPHAQDAKDKHMR